MRRADRVCHGVVVETVLGNREEVEGMNKPRASNDTLSAGGGVGAEDAVDADASEDREDGNASSGTICCVAELDSVRHGVVVETELAIKD